MDVTKVLLYLKLYSCFFNEILPNDVTTFEILQIILIVMYTLAITFRSLKLDGDTLFPRGSLKRLSRQ